MLHTCEHSYHHFRCHHVNVSLQLAQLLQQLLVRALQSCNACLFAFVAERASQRLIAPTVLLRQFFLQIHIFHFDVTALGIGRRQVAISLLQSLHLGEQISDALVFLAQRLLTLFDLGQFVLQFRHLSLVLVQGYDFFAICPEIINTRTSREEQSSLYYHIPRQR